MRRAAAVPYATRFLEGIEGDPVREVACGRLQSRYIFAGVFTCWEYLQSSRDSHPAQGCRVHPAAVACPFC